MTSRLPNDALLGGLSAVDAAIEPAAESRTIGDALSPGTIAAAVWSGRRYAEGLDDSASSNVDRTPFLREVVRLALPQRP